MSETSNYYGAPIYATVNASEVTPEVRSAIQLLVDEANAHNSTLYICVNSGKPSNPPPPPGGS